MNKMKIINYISTLAIPVIIIIIIVYGLIEKNNTIKCLVIYGFLLMVQRKE